LNIDLQSFCIFVSFTVVNNTTVNK